LESEESPVARRKVSIPTSHRGILIFPGSDLKIRLNETVEELILAKRPMGDQKTNTTKKLTSRRGIKTISNLLFRSVELGKGDLSINNVYLHLRETLKRNTV
jgi:hypothetical protein